MKNHLTLIFLLLFNFSCVPDSSSKKLVTILVDVSKSYENNVEDAVGDINRILYSGRAKDIIRVGVIGDKGFSEAIWLGSIKLDSVRKKRNNQILRFSQSIKNGPLLTNFTNNTDIRGALLAAQFKLEQTPAKEKYLVLFTDLDDDPTVDSKMRPNPKLGGITVILGNIRPWSNDNKDPEGFLKRINHWETWLTTCGATVTRAEGDDIVDKIW